MHRTLNDVRIAVLGLGYVGLPLLVEFSKLYPCTGFDTRKNRVAELGKGHDRTGEMSDAELLQGGQIYYTSEISDLHKCNVFIVAVPTPIDELNRPDLDLLKQASIIIGNALKKNDVVIYESTVYPGATEEVCVPTLEQTSGLSFNKDFFVGYSPERINPGDKTHRLPTVIKVTSGSTPEAADFVDALYASIVTAGTHKASSIKVAEAAKVIENTQRDLNIALINEFCIIFEKIGIDTEEVLQAAGTKWNFLNFRPGLVGGHCIGVDPYYLTYKAETLGYHPDVILAGRKINDEMGNYIAARVVKLMTRNRIHVVDSRILILGLAFKENCKDLRNSRVVDVVNGLQEFNATVDVHDPWIDKQEAKQEYGISLVDKVEINAYDVVIIAVAHTCFKELGQDVITAYCKQPGILFDVKYMFPKQEGIYRL